MHVKKWFPLLMVISCSSMGVQAKEFIPRAGLTLEDHSNVTLRDITKQSDTVFKPFAGFEFNEQTSQMNASVDASVRYEKYLDDTFSSQNFFDIDGYIDWIIKPNRFSWSVEDYAYSQRISILDPATPQNLQNLNVLTTGPDFLFSTEVFDSVIKLRVGDVYYSETDADNLRFIGTAFAKRYLNEYSTLGVDAGVSIVDFDADYRTDYDISAVALNYERELPYGSLTLRGGVNTADYQGGRKENSSLGELALDIERSGGVHALGIALSSKLSDPAMDAYDPLYSRLYDVAGENQINPNDITAVDVYKLERGQVRYNYQGNRVFVALAGFVTNRSYLATEGNDTEEVGYSLGVSYLLSDKMTAWASLYQSNVDYIENPDDLYVDSVNYSAGIAYQLSDTISLSARYSTTENTSNDHEREYTDDVIALSVVYRGISKTDLEQN